MKFIRVIAIAWAIYASFYLCRVNYSIALPFINAELGITFTLLGAIASGFFITYSIGQALNGYLGVRYEPCKLILIGVIGSSLATFLFGMSNDFTAFMILWLTNGYFQSMGWPSLVKVIALTLGDEELGRGYGLFNTSWALGHALSWLFTALIIENHGWRWGFTINSIAFLLLGLSLTSYLMKHAPPRMSARVPKRDGGLKSRQDIGAIALLALAYLMTYAVRYALIIYLPSYLYGVEGTTTTFMLTIVMFPLLGSLGMLSFGWLFDKLDARGKALSLVMVTPVIALLLGYFPICYERSRAFGIIMLMMLSLLLYGIESQMVSTMPVMIAGQEYSSLAVGIVDSAGSIGAFASSLISGIIIDSQGFPQMLRFWAYTQAIQLVLLITFSIIMKKKDDVITG